MALQEVNNCNMKSDLKLLVYEYLRIIPKGKVVTYGQKRRVERDGINVVNYKVDLERYQWNR